MPGPSLPLSTQRRALVDCDSFFAGCEVARRPELRGKCVCVARDEDIVLAATYEAKARGVKTGTPAREAKRILGNDIVLVKPDMAYYQQISKQVMAVLAQEANDIEVYSIDEAFIDITHHLQIHGDEHTRYENRARAIQQRVYDELGISVSIGVAPTRIIAKICAGLRKPFGVMVMTDASELLARVGHEHITQIPFISSKRAMRLAQCETVADFIHASMQYVQGVMGGSGLKLRYELHGINAISLKKPQHQKMIERTKSFHPHFTSDKELLRAYLVQNFERAYRELIAAKGVAKTIRISCRLQNFRRLQHIHTFPQHTADRDVLLNKVKELFAIIYSPRQSYRTTGVTLSDISYNTNQPSLFDKPSTSQKIYQTIEKLNEKFGGIVITSATTHRTLQKGEDSLMKIRG